MGSFLCLLFFGNVKVDRPTRMWIHIEIDVCVCISIFMYPIGNTGICMYKYTYVDTNIYISIFKCMKVHIRLLSKYERKYVSKHIYTDTLLAHIHIKRRTFYQDTNVRKRVILPAEWCEDRG